MIPEHQHLCIFSFFEALCICAYYMCVCIHHPTLNAFSLNQWDHFRIATFCKHTSTKRAHTWSYTKNSCCSYYDFMTSMPLVACMMLQYLRSSALYHFQSLTVSFAHMHKHTLSRWYWSKNTPFSSFFFFLTLCVFISVDAWSSSSLLSEIYHILTSLLLLCTWLSPSLISSVLIHLAWSLSSVLSCMLDRRVEWHFYRSFI